MKIEKIFFLFLFSSNVYTDKMNILSNEWAYTDGGVGVEATIFDYKRGGNLNAMPMMIMILMLHAASTAAWNFTISLSVFLFLFYFYTDSLI